MFCLISIEFSELKRDLITTIRDPLLDLTALKDINEEDSIPTVQSTKVTNIANQNMIRRYRSISTIISTLNA